MSAQADGLTIVQRARQFTYVREAQSEGQNHGLRVHALQVWGGGADGDSYCMEFAWDMADLHTRGEPPFARVQSCEDFHQLAIARGWVVPVPRPGCFALRCAADGHAHHIYIVSERVEADVLGTISANTSADGLSDNGDGVHEHDIPRDGDRALVYVAVPGLC